MHTKAETEGLQYELRRVYILVNRYSKSHAPRDQGNGIWIKLVTSWKINSTYCSSDRVGLHSSHRGGLVANTKISEIDTNDKVQKIRSEIILQQQQLPIYNIHRFATKFQLIHYRCLQHLWLLQCLHSYHIYSIYSIYNIYNNWQLYRFATKLLLPIHYRCSTTSMASTVTFQFHFVLMMCHSRLLVTA